MANYVVGLTGGIGSGKSAVSKAFQELGVEAVDADQVAREVVAPGSPGLSAIADKFGPDVITSEGQLDRAWLRQRVFDHPEDKQWLDGLLHPQIRQRMFELCHQANSGYVILEVPLLVEGGLYQHVDQVVVVDLDEEAQALRASRRDNSSKEQIQKIMAQQADRQTRLAHADHVIDNSGSFFELKTQVQALHSRLLDKVKACHLDTNKSKLGS